MVARENKGEKKFRRKFFEIMSGRKKIAPGQIFCLTSA